MSNSTTTSLAKEQDIIEAWKDMLRIIPGLRLPNENVFDLSDSIFLDTFKREMRKVIDLGAAADDVQYDSYRLWKLVVETVVSISGQQFFMEELIRLKYLQFRCALPIDSYVGADRRNWILCDIDPQSDPRGKIKIFGASKAIRLLQSSIMEYIYVSGVDGSLYVTPSLAVEYSQTPFYFSPTPIEKFNLISLAGIHREMFTPYFSNPENLQQGLYVPPLLLHSMLLRPHRIALKSNENTAFNTVRNFGEETVIDLRLNVNYLNALVGTSHDLYLYYVNKKPYLAAYFLLCLYAFYLNVPFFATNYDRMRTAIFRIDESTIDDANF